MQQSQATILGAGAMGMAMGAVLAANGYKVVFWDIDQEVVAGINQEHRNPRVFSQVKLGKNIKAESDIRFSFFGADMAVLAVGSSACREVAQKARNSLTANCLVISVAKGLEAGSFMTMTDVLRDVLPARFREQIMALSGPTLANELILKKPAAAMLASPKANTYSQRALAAFNNDWFHVYETRDLAGVELSAVAKHALATIFGLVDGLGYGANSKGWLMTEGFRELARLIWKLGGKEDTVYGLAGLGDTLATSLSAESRNAAFGRLLAKGKTVKQAKAVIQQTVEGVTAVESLHKLALREGLNLPVLQAIYQIVSLNKKPDKILADLVKSL